MTDNLPHRMHVPSDYEQGLMAVGILNIEDIDPNYAHYVRNYNPEYGLMSHCEWSSMVKEWHCLSAQFNEVTGGTFADLSEEKTAIADELCDRMGWLEWYLGV